MTNPFRDFNIARGHPAGGDDVLRYPVSLRNVEVAERGIDINYQTVRFLVTPL
jgi:hypothetical protein